MSEPLGAIRVIKVGGSLLSSPLLAERLIRFLDSESRYRNLLIPGTGPLSRTIREWQESHRLTDGFCHEACLRLMQVSASVLGQLLAEVPVTSDPSSLSKHRSAILDCYDQVDQITGLEPSWNTTSDTIALRVAEQINACELWLLKSTLPKSPRISQWRESGFVDAHFAPHKPGQPDVFAVNFAGSDSLSLRGK